MAGAFVQSWEGPDYAGNSTTVTVSGATANNLLVAAIANRNDVGTYDAVTGWTKFQEYTGYYTNGSVWYRIASGDSSDNFSPTWTNAVRMNVLVAEYSGLATASPLEASNDNETYVGSTTTSIGTNSATATQATGTAVAFLMVYGAQNWNTVSLTTGSLEASGTSANNYPECRIGSANYTSAGAKSDTWTTTDSGFGGSYAAIGVFKAAAAGATEAAVSFGLSANSLFAAHSTASASTNFGISANTTNTAQADRNASVGADLSFGSSNSGDAQAEAASSLTTNFGMSDSGQADTYASVNAGFVFGYTVSATVVSGAAIQAAVTFAKTFNVTAEAQADFQAAISAGTVFGKTATAEVNFGASITAVVQPGAQATADAQTEAAISVGTTLAAAIIAQAAVEAGITLASISNITFSATSLSGDVITPDGRTFTVTAEARAFTVSEEDRNFTVQ